jgi:hypothetical protein
MGTPGASQTAATTGDPFPEAIGLASGAADAGLPLKLLGGLAVRVVCPDFPPRFRRDQDIDFACLSKGRAKVAAYLERSGCEPDRRFNHLNGDRQMYFTAPSGRAIDVMVDRLAMCHTLDFRKSFSRLPMTLDVIDLLFSKLQIVKLNEKDARDIVHLLCAVPVGGDGGLALDIDRFCGLLGADWGWWRTVTGNLAKLPALIEERPDLAPANAAFDPVAQARLLNERAEAAPKGLKWRLRANVGDRVRWYQLPEEVDH